MTCLKEDENIEKMYYENVAMRDFQRQLERQQVGMI